MKSRIVLTLFLAALPSAGHALHSILGDGTRGGGNLSQAEFIDRGNQLLNVLMYRSPLILNDALIDIATMKRVFARADVLPTNMPIELHDGTPLDAVNDRVLNTIEFYEPHWRESTSDARSQLVIHEILGLNGIPDPQYLLSKRLVEYANTFGAFNAVYPSLGETALGVRSFYGARAKGLISAMVNGGRRARKVGHHHLYEMKNVICRSWHHGMEDGIPRAECNAWEDENSAASLALIEVLKVMGVAAEGAAGSMWYEIQEVNCTFVEGVKAVQAYRCDVLARFQMEPKTKPCDALLAPVEIVRQLKEGDFGPFSDPVI